jgi:hypothetical protein
VAVELLVWCGVWCGVWCLSAAVAWA